MIEMLKSIQMLENEFLEVQLNKSKDFDDYVFEQIHRDGNCIAPVRDRRNKAKFLYDVKGYCPLYEYLNIHVFEQEEAYSFFIALFQCLVKVNKNKLILLDGLYIYLSKGGEQLRVIAVPLALEYWTTQREDMVLLLKELAMRVRVEKQYELSGYLLQCAKREKLSLFEVLHELEDLWSLHKPKRKWYQFWGEKEKEEFTFQEPSRLYQAISEPMKVEEEGESYNGTVVLFEEYIPTAYLYEKNIERQIEINHVPFVIGRSKKSDFIIPRNTISLKHACIFYEDGLFFIEDCESSNGTYVNGLKLETKKELHHGDVLRFARLELEFICEVE